MKAQRMLKKYRNTVRSREVASDRMGGEDLGLRLIEDSGSGGQYFYRVFCLYFRGQSILLKKLQKNNNRLDSSITKNFLPETTFEINYRSNRFRIVLT